MHYQMAPPLAMNIPAGPLKSTDNLSWLEAGKRLLIKPSL
jgi:hypothetical protein